MALKQAHLRVHGHVHGVWFRESTRQEAERLGLAGWVRNQPDGTVEIVAEGEDPVLEQLIAWAHHGPRTARVDRVDVTWRTPSGEFHDFRVTR
jgi:acylphosphatase